MNYIYPSLEKGRTELVIYIEYLALIRILIFKLTINPPRYNSSYDFTFHTRTNFMGCKLCTLNLQHD